MKKAILACVLGLAFAGPAAAQQIMTEYYATLGPQDMRNSSGQRLGNFCAVIQQDRANYHRFGLRDASDQYDSVFADRTLRSRISNTCELVRGSEYLPDFVLNGSPRFVYVRVLNDAGQMRVLVSEGAG